jgi:hypothetical protein
MIVHLQVIIVVVQNIIEFIPPPRLTDNIQAIYHHYVRIDT